jgi:hypothetical protein
MPAVSDKKGHNLKYKHTKNLIWCIKYENLGDLKHLHNFNRFETRSHCNKGLRTFVGFTQACWRRPCNGDRFKARSN